MVVLLWIAVVVVAANILAGVVLLIRFRAETQRASEARLRDTYELEYEYEQYWRAG